MAGIYIHIPFCKKKCIYCDFYSIGALRYEADYVQALIAELAMRKQELCGEPLRTLYFGGGTPSLLPAEHVGAIVDAIKREVGIVALEEFTIEVNPDDVSEEYIRALVAVGVNRVSMGIQSFVDSELAIINRRHTAAEAVRAVEMIRQAGIDNISIDLIYGLPRQTLDSWRYSLNKAMELDVEHISCYNLSYEEGTRLYAMRERGDVNECSEDDCVQMYEALVEITASHGYEHYEVSNYAKPGRYSKHNSSYWDGSVYLGLGCAAHSYDGTQRSCNVANVKSYIAAISCGNLACERETATIDERYDEYVMIRLRTKWGVSEDDLRSRFGNDRCAYFRREAERYIKQGQVVHADGCYHLTESGVMVSDMIIRDLMS